LKPNGRSAPPLVPLFQLLLVPWFETQPAHAPTAHQRAAQLRQHPRPRHLLERRGLQLGQASPQSLYLSLSTRCVTTHPQRISARHSSASTHGRATCWNAVACSWDKPAHSHAHPRSLPAGTPWPAAGTSQPKAPPTPLPSPVGSGVPCAAAAAAPASRGQERSTAHERMVQPRGRPY
jgi:hypothetical protein